MAKYFILTLSLAIIIFTACNKKATPSAASMSDILRTGRWKVSSGTLTVTLPSGKDTALNYLNWIPGCHLDDYFDFNSPTTGAVFNGSVLCNPSDPDSISFVWKLTNNNTCISIWNSDHLYYSVSYSVLEPFVFDTLQTTPYLVLDTLLGVNDTAAGYARIHVVLDTIWNLYFTYDSVANTDIYNAPITNFSKSSFTINFSLLSSRWDTTNNHTGRYIYTDPLSGNPDTLDFNPISRIDTFKYSVTYTNF